MSLWLKVRRVPTCAITIVAVAVTIFIVSNRSLPLPNLFGGPTLAIPIAFLVPLAVAICLAWGLATGNPLLEAVASRPLQILDIAFALSIAILALLACVLVGTLGDAPVAFAAGRNVLGYVGMLLIGRRVIGIHAAAAIPTGFAFAVSLFGSGPDNQPRWWAWPLATANDAVSWSLAVVILILGTTMALAYSESTVPQN